MSKNLFVGGKEYVQSDEIARSFGYSSEYVDYLAKDKKITAACIHNQWYVEKDSLQKFADSRTEEVEIVSPSEKRAQEVYAKIHSQKKLKQRNDITLAVAQSITILFCGILLGSLGWMVIEADMQVAQLLTGAHKSMSHIKESVMPHKSIYTDLFTPFSN